MTISQVCRQSSGLTLVRPRRIQHTLPARPPTAYPGSPMLLLPAALGKRSPTHQWLTRVRPTIGMGMTPVILLQKNLQSVLELRYAGIIPTSQKTTRQHAEPQLHLIQPRAMLRREVKHVLVRRVAQKRPPLTARPQSPRVERDITERRNPLAHFHAPVCVQVVHHPVKTRSVTEIAGHLADVPGEVHTGPRRAKIPDHFAGGYHERGDQRPRPVADVFKLLLLRMAGPGWLRGILALQDLHAGLLIAADHQASLLVQTGSIQVQPADGLSLGIEIRVMAVEPVDAFVRLDVCSVEDTPDGGPAHGSVAGLVDDGGRQVIQVPTCSRLVMLLGLAGGQADDGREFVGGKNSGVV